MLLAWGISLKRSLAPFYIWEIRLGVAPQVVATGDALSNLLLLNPTNRSRDRDCRKDCKKRACFGARDAIGADNDNWRRVDPFKEHRDMLLTDPEVSPFEGKILVLKNPWAVATFENRLDAPTSARPSQAKPDCDPNLNKLRDAATSGKSNQG